MQINFKFLPTLILPLVLSGCEIFTSGKITGELRVFTEAQQHIPGEVPGTDGTLIDLEVNNQCTGQGFTVMNSTAGPTINLRRGPVDSSGIPTSVGKLTIDQETFTIYASYCGDGILNPLMQIQANRLDALSGGVYLAVRDSDNTEVPEYITIATASFASEDLTEDAAPFAGRTAILVNVSSLDSINADLTNAYLGGTIDLIMDDPGSSNRDVIVQAALDLDALITDEYTKTNWILSGALFKLESAANESNWESDNLLIDGRGRGTYIDVARAVRKIERVANATDDVDLMASLDSITTALLDSMRSLTVDRIALAVENSGDEFRIARANYRLEHGDIERGQDHLRIAVRRYGGAWRAATQSMR